MALNTRLNRLEQKATAKKNMIAFFSLPDNLSCDMRRQIEQEMWQQYLKGGGDPSFSPSFYSNLGDTPGFLFCISREEFGAMIDNLPSSKELVIEK